MGKVKNIKKDVYRMSKQIPLGGCTVYRGRASWKINIGEIYFKFKQFFRTVFDISLL